MTIPYAMILGVNTWNSLRCRLMDEKNIKLYADAMVSSGLLDAGYRYLIMDDCWSERVNGRLVAHRKRFPRGLKYISDYVHDRGLLLGIYSDRGVKTCAGFAGSGGHEVEDALMFARNNINLLKYDSCYATSHRRQALAEYRRMETALIPYNITLQVCGWNTWYAREQIGSTWRISSDVEDWPHLYRAVRANENLSAYGPGNDPDMLLGTLSNNQLRTQFSLWSIMSSPLILGMDPGAMSHWQLNTYTNRDVINVQQNAIQGVYGIIPYVVGETFSRTLKTGQVLWIKTP